MAVQRTYPDPGSMARQALAVLATPSQHARLIQLDAPVEGLVVERFEGSEAVCAPFRFEVDVLATSAFLDSDELLGKPLALKLARADGQRRRWHGLCTAVAPLGGDGGLARYRLLIEPWTALLTHRRNALVFQDLDLHGVLGRLFADYPQSEWRFDVTRRLPVRAITTQYRETDWEFATRLLADAGLAWRYEHAQAADDGAEAGHTLVIFDQQAEVPEGRKLRFHRTDATERDDAISAFTRQRRLVPNRSQVGSWHGERLASTTGMAEADAGGMPVLEVYTQPGDGAFEDSSHAQAVASQRLDAMRLPQDLYAGSGSVRDLAAGVAYSLVQHAVFEAAAFVPLNVVHVGANNLGAGITALLAAPELEHGSYRNRFVAAPAGVPIAPLPRPRPTVHGPQTARVVGLPDAAVTSTRDHQVRIQFAWQRGPAPNPGGLTETASSHPGHAPGDHTSGTWVPVAEWIAGPNWGSHFLPRIGAEVLVEFAHGDIDQPRITGQLYNGEVAPPFGGGIDGPDNHPGTLSGLHTQSHDGAGTQQWLLDDTPGQLRTRLHTSLADSRLELGYLVGHQGCNRGGLRGEGMELAAEGWGNVHAGQGLLLSTTVRPEGASTQMDIAEAVGQLKGAERTAGALHDTLEQQQVPGFSANDRLAALREAIDPEEQGHYTGSVGGQSAMKPASGSREPGEEPVERFADPKLVAESPESIAFATRKSAVAFAGGALHLTVQQDAQLSAGNTISSVSGQHAALYAHAGPIRAIAARGPVSLQAHTGELEVLADQSVSVTASDERIDVLAKEKIVLQAGETRVTLEGGDITFECPGNFTVKGAQVPFRGGTQGQAALGMLPTALVGDPFLASATLLRSPDNEGPHGDTREQSAGRPPSSGQVSAGAPGSDPSASAEPIQYVNFDVPDAKWNDGTLLTSMDAQGRNPSLLVKFNKEGVFPFKVTVKPSEGNSIYSSTEKSRNEKYNYTSEQRSYTTEPDGTLVIKDFALAAGGGDRYTFEVTDENNIVIHSQVIETRRRIFLQEIKMAAPVEALAAADLNVLKSEFAKHGIEVSTDQTPAVTMPAMVNVAPGADEQTMQAGARAAYAASQGARLEPYTTAVIYTGHLAARQADPLEISELVTTGPGQADVTITVADFLSGRALWLWNNIVPGEDWLDSAVLYPTSPDGVTLPPITIPRSDIVHVPEDPSVPDRSKAVRVRVSGLTQAVTSGTILLSVYVVDRFRGGLAFPDSNLICVCTRAWWKNYSTQSQNEVMIHELGHKIGLVPGGTAWRSYDRSKLDKAPHFYETSQGHVGNHCHAGIAAKPVPQKYTSHDAAASICVMYGQTNDHSAFCPDCAKAARKVDLSSGWIRF